LPLYFIVEFYENFVVLAGQNSTNKDNEEIGLTGTGHVREIFITIFSEHFGQVNSAFTSLIAICLYDTTSIDPEVCPFFGINPRQERNLEFLVERAIQQGFYGLKFSAISGSECSIWFSKHHTGNETESLPSIFHGIIQEVLGSDSVNFNFNPVCSVYTKDVCNKLQSVHYLKGLQISRKIGDGVRGFNDHSHGLLSFLCFFETQVLINKGRGKISELFSSIKLVGLSIIGRTNLSCPLYQGIKVSGKYHRYFPFEKKDFLLEEANIRFLLNSY
jgi:hypothetical protein